MLYRFFVGKPGTPVLLNSAKDWKERAKWRKLVIREQGAQGFAMVGAPDRFGDHLGDV